MKNLIAIAFAAASIVAGPAILVTPSQAAPSGPCYDGTAPEAWMRPGGYCSRLGLGAGSLSDPAEECEVDLKAYVQGLPPFDSVDVAAVYDCYDPCLSLSVLDFIPADMVKGDRVDLALPLVCY